MHYHLCIICWARGVVDGSDWHWQAILSETFPPPYYAKNPTWTSIIDNDVSEIADKVEFVERGDERSKFCSSI